MGRSASSLQVVREIPARIGDGVDRRLVFGDADGDRDLALKAQNSGVLLFGFWSWAAMADMGSSSRGAIYAPELC